MFDEKIPGSESKNLFMMSPMDETTVYLSSESGCALKLSLHMKRRPVVRPCGAAAVPPARGSRGAADHDPVPHAGDGGGAWLTDEDNVSDPISRGNETQQMFVCVCVFACLCLCVCVC